MSHIATSSGLPSRIQPHLAGLCLISVCAVALALLGTTKPVLLVGVLGAIGVCTLLTLSLDSATWIALFVIYSNVAVVAVKYHGVPSIVGNAVAGLLLIPVACNVVLSGGRIVAGPTIPWLLGLLFVQFLGALFSEMPVLAFDNFIVFVLEGGVVYLLVRNAVRTKQQLLGATWSILAASLLMGGIPSIQQVTRNFESEFGGFAQTSGEPGFELEEGDSSSVQFRLSGPIGEKNRYAQIMLMLVPLALFRLRDEKNIGLKVLAAIFLFFSAAGVFLAFSRSTLIVVALVVVLAAMLNLISRSKVVVVGLLGVALLMASPVYRSRMASLVSLGSLVSGGQHSSADGALKGRATEMGAAALVFLDHPFLGVGPGLFRYYSREYGERIGLRSLAPERQAHCLPLDVAAENGIFGLICLVGIFFSSMVALRKAISIQQSRDPDLTGLAFSYLLMVALYFAAGLFLHFAFIRYFWLMMALADSAIAVSNKSALESYQPAIPRNQ